MTRFNIYTKCNPRFTPPARHVPESQPGIKPEWRPGFAGIRSHADPLLSPHREYLCLDRGEHDRQHAYRQLFRTHLDPEQLAEIRNATNGNFALGHARFQAEIARMVQRRVAPGKSGRPARGAVAER